MNGQQGGDPAKLANALVQLADQEKPPLRWVRRGGCREQSQGPPIPADAYSELPNNLHDDA